MTWLEQRVMGRLQPSSQLKEEQIIAFLGELGRGILISMKNGVPRAEPHFFPVLVFKKKKKKKSIDSFYEPVLF